MKLATGIVFKITSEMKQDITNRNWPTWQYKHWRVGNKVVITSVNDKRIVIMNPKAASTSFSPEIIGRAVQVME